MSQDQHISRGEYVAALVELQKKPDENKYLAQFKAPFRRIRAEKVIAIDDARDLTLARLPLPRTTRRVPSVATLAEYEFVGDGLLAAAGTIGMIGPTIEGVVSAVAVGATAGLFSYADHNRFRENVPLAIDEIPNQTIIPFRTGFKAVYHGASTGARAMAKGAPAAAFASHLGISPGLAMMAVGLPVTGIIDVSNLIKRSVEDTTIRLSGGKSE